jgi:undecaprenyl pyrophosphate phosphatase UppP
MRWKEETGSRRGKNWMSAMGILFMITAAIIAIRNLVIYSIEYSIGFFFDNFVNAQITNEKFVIVMLAAGGFLLYWGYFKKKEEYGPPDEHDWRRSGR